MCDENKDIIILLLITSLGKKNSVLFVPCLFYDDVNFVSKSNGCQQIQCIVARKYE